MKFLDFKAQATRHLSMQKMMQSGYGWEDICVSWGINDAEQRLRIRRMVLDRGKRERGSWQSRQSQR